MSSKQVTFFKYIQIDKSNHIQKDMVDVTFIKDINKFVGIDLKHYGPYRIGDKAKIHILNSKGLLKKGGCIIDKN